MKLLISGGLLYLIMLKIDWMQFTVSIRRGNLLYLTYGMIFGIIFNMIKFLRWRNLIRTENSMYSYWDATKSYMLGNCLGLITPMRAGDLSRALYFSREDRPRIMGLTVIDRVMDIAAVLVMSIAGSFYLINKSFGMLIVMLAILSLLFLYSNEYLKILLKKIIPSGSRWDKISKLIDMLRNFNTKTISSALMLSVLAFVLVLFQFYYLVAAFEKGTFMSICLVTPLITLSSIIPISFMGLGVRESISIILFSTFGISEATALSAAFLGFIMNNVMISIIGIYYLSKINLNLTKK